jgi:site-specific DNA-cytosine methylase
MKYVELFAGLGAGSIAVNKVFSDAKCIGYSEIYKPSIQVYENHFPSHNNMGDIKKIIPKEIPDFDLLISGFPCKQLTILSSKYHENLQGKDSGLFYPMLDIIKTKKPKYFVIENVASMDDSARDQISEMLGASPIHISSSLVSAQARERYYWCNFPVTQPEDRGIMFQDILETTEGGYKYPVAWSRSTRGKISDGGYYDERIRFNGKSNTCVTGEGCSAFSSKNVVIKKKPKKPLISNSFVDKNDSLLSKLDHRLLTVKECERLQTFPDNWTNGMSKRHAYHALGDAFTVEVIVHIMRCLKKHVEGKNE